ncbi:glycosyltransferase [Halobacterium salinarum]|uniref:Glycosyltransferase involved in cell wall bisynthesis n=1 Tax=Halobacterium salinarum (strain ATCC 33171 / DSM 3754 / JCM 8978 / NBRC 102687 / NCIMB 764 / 91-R6) TaxID=2597657 RepID=A0A4D6GT39_HALS9|nr:glycosyltransferase [Halobacterium salinarum]QCC44905.1 putative glycosyltransferase, type 1 [Halobacterium salinarum]TYO73668.1 Glycosyltransferase involved in cell wall bisynthesis [Halobacterium salinarum DSM 3754]
MNSGDDPVEDVAIAHWGEHVNGGGDRVAWELARVFEDAPLYVGWQDESIEPADIQTEQVIEGRFLEWALEQSSALRMFAHLLGWQKAEPLRDYDVLVTSGNEPLFYVPPTEQVWVSYIHHTNRRQSDQIDEVGDGFTGSIKLLFYYLVRVMFDHNTHKPDLFLANSEQVKRRMIRYWGIPEEKIDVVYPPVDTNGYSPSDAETGNYYLTLSRLDWHKSVNGIVRAFEGLDKKLVVAGDGPDREDLERIAGENVEFAGYVSESEKRELLAGAKAFVFNGQDEDFGMSPVEALAAGTPLLGVKEGMTQYQIVDGKNGYTFERDETGEAIRAAVRRCEDDGVKWDDLEIEAFADRFSVQSFHDRMHEAVERATENANVTPDWYSEVDDPSPDSKHDHAEE